MTALFILSLFILALACGGAVFSIHKAYIHTIDGLRADNKDLRDRLFAKNALPPSGVDMTEKYEERQERQKRQDAEPKPKKAGPIESLEAKWAADDRVKAGRMNIDATKSRIN